MQMLLQFAWAPLLKFCVTFITNNVLEKRTSSRTTKCVCDKELWHQKDKTDKRHDQNLRFYNIFNELDVMM